MHRQITTRSPRGRIDTLDARARDAPRYNSACIIRRISSPLFLSPPLGSNYENARSGKPSGRREKRGKTETGRIFGKGSARSCLPLERHATPISREGPFGQRGRPFEEYLNIYLRERTPAPTTIGKQTTFRIVCAPSANLQKNGKRKGGATSIVIYNNVRRLRIGCVSQIGSIAFPRDILAAGLPLRSVMCLMWVTRPFLSRFLAAFVLFHSWSSRSAELASLRAIASE